MQTVTTKSFRDNVCPENAYETSDVWRFQDLLEIEVC